MSAIHVFAGETLPRDELARFVSQVLLHPPARRGDLLGVAGPGDVVVIIDGDPHHPPRHDEILSLLASGVAVAGAGGLGAVLAADMHPYGMTGIGNVFAGLQDGSITDDEAAGQWPGGRGDLRTLLTLAAARGTITHSDARRIAEQAGPGSGHWTWADLCRTADLSLESPLRQLHAWMQRRAAITYAARSDARKAVGLAAAGLLDAPFVPTVPWPRLAPGLAARDEGAGCGGLPARLLTLALYCAQWPGRWHRYVLSRAGYAVGDLHPGELPDGVARRWLTPGEVWLSSGEQARRVLVRAAVRDPCSPAWPVTRRDAEALASGLAAAVPPFPPRDWRGLARIWEVPEADLGVTALDRGFGNPVSALRYAASQDA
jgi:TfuA-like protein